MDALMAQALRAREAGEHERAIACWRALLRHRPDDWRLALELKRDLKAALHYPESDPQFRRAARSLPEGEWLAHYTSLYAYHGEDLEALDARARGMLERMPGEHLLWAILGDVASQRRDWAGSERAFAEAYAVRPRAEYAFKRETARMYGRLGALLRTQPASGRRCAIAYMNLDRNPERAAELGRQFARSEPPLHRIAGIEGRRLAASVVRRLGGDPHMRGTLGCFLSHVAAWEAMLDRGDPVCLFIEDDVIPLLDLPATLGALPVPAHFDLVFVNDRIAPRLDPASVERFTIHSLRSAMHAFHPEDNAPGGDGYLLSAAGARKLLAWVTEDGFAEDVDWRLIAYGLAPEDIASLPRPSHAGPWLDRISQLVRRPDRLDAYVLHPPLIRTVGVSSDREDENRLHPG
ncbi:MAG: glycosyltransferase family 25 protein [Acetobacteraceae bacterium]|nr:glycosyltransferase family 25 protein [Acetobacteraceae bacterium]